MCLYILKEMPKKLTTTKHYVVYKRLYLSAYAGKLAYVPPYYDNFIYEPGKLNEINTLCSQKSWLGNRRIVERGFHAYRSRAGAKSQRCPGENIKPCIVPAGSEVFYGEDDEVVSNKLIVFKSIEQLNKWCANNPVT